MNIAIVEDDAGMRETLAAIIQADASLACVSVSASGEEALKSIPREEVSVSLVDIHLPRMSGIELVRKLKQALPAMQILMLTTYSDSELIFDSLKAGAAGFLLKRTPPAELLDAIHQVSAGGSPMSPEIARKVVSYFQSQRTAAPELALLTPRELEILAALSRGYQYKEIADRMAISIDTVRTHVRNTYEKLHVTCRAEATLKYLQR